MSRAGCPYDNAMAESFMKTLKHEEVDASAYRDLAHASAAIGEFIETAYNRQKAPLGSCLLVAGGVRVQPAPGCCAAARGYDAAELSVIACLTKGVHSIPMAKRTLRWSDGKTDKSICLRPRLAGPPSQGGRQ